MNTSKKDIIRNIYLYLVTLIGLIMIIIPSVDLIKIGLEATLFPLASQDEYGEKPPEPFALRGQVDPTNDSPVTEIKLSDQEQRMFAQWKTDYQNWQERQENTDRAAIRRQRNMVRDISTLVVGLALFISHGTIIRKKQKHEA